MTYHSSVYHTVKIGDRIVQIVLHKKIDVQFEKSRRPYIVRRNCSRQRWFRFYWNKLILDFFRKNVFQADRKIKRLCFKCYIAIENITSITHWFCCCKFYFGCQTIHNYLRIQKRYCCYCQFKALIICLCFTTLKRFFTMEFWVRLIRLSFQEILTALRHILI